MRGLAAAGITLLTLAALAAAPASAAVHHAAPADAAASTQAHFAGRASGRSRVGAVPHGIGFGGRLAPGVSTAQVFQCPEYFCNQGTDYAGNDIAGICTVTDNNGQWHWTFTLDHADNVIGFIPTSEFQSSVTLGECPGGLNWDDFLAPAGASTVYQCPESFCNKGIDYGGNIISSFCNVQQDNGPYYLTLDGADDVVGFWPGADLGAPDC